MRWAGDIYAQVSAKLEDANVIDTISHAKSVDFDLSAQGQVDLAQGGVSGRIITAMKARARHRDPSFCFW
jgi:hypothetical protein